MERLIDQSQLQGILERGLVTGKWSIAEFGGVTTGLRFHWLNRASLPALGFEGPPPISRHEFP